MSGSIIRISYLITSSLLLAACGDNDSPRPIASNAGNSGAGGATPGSSAGAGGFTEAEGGAGSAGTSGSPSSARCRIPTSETTQPSSLRDTGCVNMQNPAKPAQGLVPYDVNSPLWSDGASKERFVFIPEGQKIRVKDCTAQPVTCQSIDDGGTANDEGHWEFPLGTVLVKNFSLGSERVETRLLMRMDDSSWLGFSYEWNEAGSEATLLPDSKSKSLASGQVWHFPSRAECFQCHTTGAGISLGPSTAQLNAAFAYADGSMNQIKKFVALGYLTSEPKPIAGYPKPTASGPLETRARAYLHANCSICHRPGGTVGDVDLRFTTPFKDTRLCGENIQRGTGDPNLPQKRLVPGHPEQSSLSFRVHNLGAYRMPKLGSAVVDSDAVKLLDDWIISIESCP